MEGSTTAKVERIFDFSKHGKRHVALKIAYLGYDYDGFVVQTTSQQTIEAALFEALLKTKLIESRETSSYHRCGRTDKGVSALGQVISLTLRSKKRAEQNTAGSRNETTPSSSGQVDSGEEEGLNYARILNAVLPAAIRVVAWASVANEFSARFNCRSRTYKYWFPKCSLNIANMDAACKLLVGEHDFRNFCKLDSANEVAHCRRCILSANVTLAERSSHSIDGYDIYVITICGQAFLWHQIRCIVAILVAIGEGNETIEIVNELLDIKACQGKPQYAMAVEFPLNLYDCAFDDVTWNYDKMVLEAVIKHFQAVWVEFAVKAAMVKNMLDSLSAPINDGKPAAAPSSECIVSNGRVRVYRPIMKRPRGDPPDVKLSKSAKKQKRQLNTDVDQGIFSVIRESIRSVVEVLKA